MSYRFRADSDDVSLLEGLLAAAAGGCVDLVHNDPDAPQSPAVLVESVANGLVNVWAANEDGEPVGDEYTIDLDRVRRVEVW